MRTLLFGVFAVLVIGGMLARATTRPAMPLGRLRVQLALGSAVGALGALGVLTSRIDLVPDTWEPLAVAAVGLVIAAGVFGSILAHRLASR